MEKKRLPNKIKATYCAFFGHKYEVSRSVTLHVKEYKCCNCQKQMTTNSNGYLTELTPKFKEINSTLERIHKNKLNRYASMQVLKMSS